MLDIINFIFNFIGDILELLGTFYIYDDVSLLSLFCALLILPVLFSLFKVMVFDHSLSEEKYAYRFESQYNGVQKAKQRSFEKQRAKYLKEHSGKR